MLRKLKPWRGPKRRLWPSPSGFPPAPFQQTEWPNPVLRKQFGVFEVAASLLVTTLAVTAAIPRAPLYVQRAIQPAQVVAGPPNLLTSTLGTTQAAAAPFSQEDWPNPRGPRSVSQDVTQNTLVKGLSQPFVQKDWANPGRRSTAITLETQNLLGTLLAPVVTSSDVTRGALSTPIQPRLVQQPALFPNLAITSQTAASPFFQNDWPNPLGGKAAPSFDPPSLLTGKLVAAPLPVSQSDWPNPRKAVGLQPEIPQNLLPLAPAQAQTPFTQSDWPNPRGSKPAPLSDPPSLLTGKLVAAPLPVSQLDWPNPLQPRQPQQPDAPNTLTSGLAIPFSQTDWSNPIRAVPAQAFESTNLQSTLLFSGTPFAQADWPNPIPARSAQLQGTISSNIAALTTPPPQLPYNQSDWPVPRGYAYPSSLRTFVGFAPIGFFPPAPPNRHRLYMDVVTGKLFWQISQTAPGSPTLIQPL